MGRKKSHEERTQIITRIIELVRERGRMTTRDVVTTLGLHENTARRYMRNAVFRGDLVRYGRCGIFRDQRATIDFDRKRFTHNKAEA